MNKQQFNYLLKQLDKDSVKLSIKYQKQLLIEYKKALEFVRTKYKKLLSKYEGDSNAFILSKTQLNNIEIQIQREILNLHNNVSKIIDNGIMDNFIFNYKEMTDIIGQGIQTKITLGVINKDSIKASVLNPYDWQGRQLKYSNNLIKGIKSAVSQGQITGQSYNEINKVITNKFNVSANNSMRIVRTELHRNESVARLKSVDKSKAIAEKLNYKLEKIWSASGGARQDHEDINGTECDENGFWYPGGVPAKGPGMSGDAAEDVNCRCTIIINLNKQ